MSDQQLTADVENAVARLEALPDPVAREAAREAIASVLALHKAALARVLERLPALQLQLLSQEPLVSSVLVLHELHPADLKKRLEAAVEKARPLLAINGASASMALSDAGEVRLTLTRGAGCGSTGTKLRAVLEQAVLELAPDAGTVRIDEVSAS